MPPAAEPQQQAQRPGLSPHDFSRIAQDLQIRKVQVEAVAHLLDEGNTIPFITRYRKERTGGLDEEVLRVIQDRLAQARALAERKAFILRTLEATQKEKLTEELRAAILAADNPKRLEDLYHPFKRKRNTLAETARQRGLENLALAIWNADPVVADLESVLPTLINPEQELHTTDAVLEGAGHILAELIADTADVRGAVRYIMWESGRLVTSRSEKLAEGQGQEYRDYFAFSEPVKVVPPHRILAINRGEKDNALTVKIDWDAPAGRYWASERLPLPRKEAPPPEPEPHAHHGRGRGQPFVSRLPDLEAHPHRAFLEHVLDDSLARLIVPSIEREIRRELTQRAEQHAVAVFARNLRSKLLAAPLRGKRVLAIDPAFRTGCKLVALDEHGELLGHDVIFPHQPQNRKAQARRKLERLLRKHQIQVVAIGNGTACRETEELVSDLLAEFEARRANPEMVDPLTLPEPAPRPPRQPKSPPKGPPAAPASEGEQPPPLPAEYVAQFATAPEPAEAEAPGPAAEVAAPAPPTDEGADGPAAVLAAAAAAEPASESASAAEAAALAPEPAPPAPMEPVPPPALPELAYVIVNEAGASVYSASPIAREELPQFDASLRGTVSIGRRLQDPLSELVKIDPQHVGVGLYQHDVNPRHLRESLDAVVESCVNTVGVDVNTASKPLLQHVSGIGPALAESLVEYRKAHGPFRTREGLLTVPGIGPSRFVQAAGFLKVNGEEPLDRTWIHPESYPAAREILSELGTGPEALLNPQSLEELRGKLAGLNPEEVAARLQARGVTVAGEPIGVPTVAGILEALARPGRDPREDLPPPVFKKGVLKLEDLQPGMELKGTVLNVVDFGAFIDVGLKDSGLVHISQMANRYVKTPHDVVSVGDVVTVYVLKVEGERHRVSLSMIPPGTERKPPERGQRSQGPPRGERGHPPRGDRPPPQHREGPPRGEGQGPPPRGERPPRGDHHQGSRPPREGAGRGEPRGGGGRPGTGSGGRKSTLPPRGVSRIGSAAQKKGAKPGDQVAAAPEGDAAAATPDAARASKKPAKKKPAAHLAEGVSGKAPLSSFSQLAALLARQDTPAEAPAPPPPPAAAEPPAPEAPPPQANEGGEAPPPA
jgi:uncharacterized protein